MHQSIKIADSEYPIDFKVKAFKMLGEKWNCIGPISVLNKFQKELFPNGIPEESVSEDGGEVDLDGIDFPFSVAPTLYDVVSAGHYAATGNELDISFDVFEEEIMLDIATIGKIISGFMNSFSKKQESQGNAEPRSKARQIATSKKPGKNKSKKN